ncbi:MAG: N-acetylneuraminate synthase family protein [Treponema sp.]|jgi:N-acetylneuraminate synthase|nr:N-acetylneuraminate synthase family protein [Treponema sp.]
MVKPAKKPFIIAELGTSHGGDAVKAGELVRAAAEAGADCVKCQIVYADEILHPKSGLVPLPGGAVPLYETFKKLEQPPEFYANIKECAEKAHVRFLASPFGPKSAAILRELSPWAVKIASPELNYLELLRETGSWGVPVFLSGGVSTLGDIETALGTVRAAGSGALTLLHCVTAYPAPCEDYNLRIVANLSHIFGVEAGVSDHSTDPLIVPLTGLYAGMTVLEKHFCLSRSHGGLDDPVALEPPAFALMCRELERAAAADRAELLRELERSYGAALINAVLGTGVKVLAPSEKENYGRTNRSLHARAAINAGETLTADLVGVLRSEKKLRPGLPPCWKDLVIGRRARLPIPNGEGIRFEDLS